MNADSKWSANRSPNRAEVQRRAKLKYRYNLTVEEWDSMLAAQGGGCAICHTTEPGGSGRFHVDHSQECCPGRNSCGKCVRGLLCAPCNTMVRQIERMRAALEYLERHER